MARTQARCRRWSKAKSPTISRHVAKSSARRHALAQFEDTAKNLPTLFPASLKGAKFEGDYSPSPKIWSDKAGFDAAIASFAKTVTEAKAKIKDLDSLKATMPAIGKECSNCHETFRVKG